jgi:hypothetical protein
MDREMGFGDLMDLIEASSGPIPEEASHVEAA